MNKEKIYFFRYIVMPVALSWLANDTYGSVGEQDRGDFEKDFNEILDLALIGMEQKTQLSQEATTKGTTCDLISRQAAIDALDCINGVEEVLKSLPSVQPEAPCYLGSPCEYQNPNAEIQEERTDKHTETRACDSISRQAAIDVVNSIDNLDAKAKGGICINLMGLPPAQPERKKGKWIKNDNGTYSCSLCHSWIPEEQHYYAQFCLYCGADMRGEPNETD